MLAILSLQCLASMELPLATGVMNVWSALEQVKPFYSLNK